MDDPEDRNNIAGESGLFISAEGLKGKQSVRATFKLPEHIIELLGIVATQLGLKQKSIFDQLVEDAEVLDKVAENAHEYALGQKERRQKTFVLSKRSVQVLDAVARRQNIARDVLVEISILRLLPVMNAEQEKHKKRSLIHQDMKAYLDHGKLLLQKADRLLGQEDQAYEMVKRIVDVCDEQVSELESIIEKGQSMENYKVHKESG